MKPKRALPITSTRKKSAVLTIAQTSLTKERA